MSSVALALAGVCGGMATGLAIASVGMDFPFVYSPLEVPLTVLVLALTYLLFGSSSKPKAANLTAFWNRCPNVPSGDDKADFMVIFDALNAELLEDLESKEARPLPICPVPLALSRPRATK